MSDKDEEDRMYEESATDIRRTLNDGVLRRPIGQLKLGAPTSAPGGSTVRQAVDVMAGAGNGCCLILRADGRIAGILTERDVLMKVLGKGLDLAKTKVDAVMTPDPEQLHVGDPIGFAMNKMAIGGYRHIPIVDAERKPVGVLSIRRIIRYLADFFPQDVINLPHSPDASDGRDRDGA